MVFNQQWYTKYTVILGGIILSIYAMIQASAILQPLIFAVFFAVLLVPFCNWMERHKVPRILSSLLAVFLGLGMALGVGFFIYSQLAQFTGDIDLLISRLESIIDEQQAFLSSWFGLEEDLIDVDIEWVQTALYDFFIGDTQAMARGVLGAATVVMSVVLIPFFMFLILTSRDFLKEFLLRASGKYDLARQQKVGLILDKMELVVQGYIRGILIVITILAFLNSTMLLILGVEHAIFFGVFAAMLNVIPFLGPIIGSILPILYAFITMDSLVYPLVILLGFYIIQLFESNLITPVVVGSQVSINAFVALLLLFIGAQIWGLVGMILFIPVGAILKVIFNEVESLEPYAFVMGRVPPEMRKKKGVLARRISRLAIEHELEEKAKKEKRKLAQE